MLGFLLSRIIKGSKLCIKNIYAASCDESPSLPPFYITMTVYCTFFLKYLSHICVFNSYCNNNTKRGFLLPTSCCLRKINSSQRIMRCFYVVSDSLLLVNFLLIICSSFTLCILLDYYSYHL